MTRPISRQYTRSLMLMMSGMSCSITSIAAPSSRRISLDQRTERLGLALRDAGGRLVEAEHPGVEGEQPGQLDDAAGARGEVGDAAVGVAAEAEEVDELVGLGAPWPLAGGRHGAGTARWRAARCGRAPRARPRTVSRTVSSGNSVAAWNVRPRPMPGPACRAGRRRRRRRGARPRRADGTKPPIAFISVDLPAPLVPMRPDDLVGADLAGRRRRPRRCRRSARVMPATSSAGDVLDDRRPRRARRAPAASSRRAFGRRRARVSMPPTRTERVARRVHDLHQPAGEVEQQDQQAEARGQQRHQRRCRGRTRAAR